MVRNNGFPEATQRITASCHGTMLGQRNLKAKRMTQTGERWRDLSIQKRGPAVVSNIRKGIDVKLLLQHQ
jgi:hypothetical protein